MQETNQSEGRAAHPEHPQTGPDVTVTVDTVVKTVHRGSYIVAEFKQVVGVDPAKELDEVIGGEFKPLDDAARIVIKGGEIFVSHVRTGASS
jgi:hypothetical protein